MQTEPTVEATVEFSENVNPNEVAASIRDLIESPEHVARCHCGAGVKLRRSRSGAAFVVLERYGIDHEASIGIGPNGLPSCPHGHGEMTILTDGSLPAADAIAQVAERINGAPQQLSLPGASALFNDSGALEHIFEILTEVEALKTRYEQQKERAAKCKRELDDMRATFEEVIRDYKEKRKARFAPSTQDEDEAGLFGCLGGSSGPQGEAGPEGSNLIRCDWERMNPGETCAVCADEALRQRPEFGLPNSEQHAVAVKTYLADCRIEALLKALHAVGVVVAESVVADFTNEQYAEVADWAAYRATMPDEAAVSLPAALGRPHVLGPSPVDGAERCVRCSVCGVNILEAAYGEEPVYPEGTRFGIDCPGTAQEPARQIRRRRAAKTRG